MGLTSFDTTASFYGPQNDSSARPSASPSTGSNTVSSAMTGSPPPAQSIGSVQLFPQLQGTVFGMPLLHLFVFAAIGIFIYYLAHRHIPKIEEEIATPRVGLGSFFSIGFQAMIFIILMKVAFTKIRIPGFSDMVATA